MHTDENNLIITQIIEYYWYAEDTVDTISIPAPEVMNPNILILSKMDTWYLPPR